MNQERVDQKGLCVLCWGHDTRQFVSEEDCQSEIIEIARGAGITILETCTVKLKHPFYHSYLGKGKVEEIKGIIETLSILDCMVINVEITPAQQRNLEEAWGIPVYTKTALIHLIFADRAHSAEGKIKVGLARLRYQITRLSGQGKEMSRLGGGIGTRGPGEQKIEAERRRYKEKIGQLTKELEKISRQRVIRRSLRIKKNIPTVAIVGYTNAGKSTLLNALTGAHAYVEDRMFATLDPSTRKAFIPGLGNIIFSDTVGFIREMPKTLLDAFRATLEEIKDADLILEVIDLSDPNYSAHFHIINKTLQDLEVEGIPVIVVLNKIDRLDAPPALEHEITSAFPVVFLSSQQKTGFEQLYILMKTALQENCQVIQLVVDYSELPSVEKEIYRSGYIENMKTLPDGRIQIVCIVQKEVADKICKTLRQPSLFETSSHLIK